MNGRERFTVSHEGMREQNAGRPPWELVKELIQNCWDEAPEATECWVSIKSTKTGTTITVEDDGPGFADITDSYTLLKNTPKRRDPRKRGRFNLGEKELISVAKTARVDTVGHTVKFPEAGGRKSEKNQRGSGTKVTATMPWTKGEALELEMRLRRFRPTECSLTVNGWRVPMREAVATRTTILESILQDSAGEPMRKTHRKTEIELLAVRDGESAWLYEMGIPIQEIDTPWDIDIFQKVPMPPNRTEVPLRYLKTIYAEALNAGRGLMEDSEFGQGWVKMAMNEERTEADSVKATVEGRYGKKAVLTSNDGDANMQASEDGYQLVNPKSLTPTERKRFRNDGGMQTAKDLFGDNDRTNVTLVLQPKEEEKPFIYWVIDLAAACELKAKVLIIHEPARNGKGKLADCTADSRKPTLRFNKHLLPEGFLLEPLNRAEQIELVCHELGHAIAGKGMEHGPKWGHGVAEAAGGITAWLTEGKEAA